MARAYLFVILIGGLIGALLPSGGGSDGNPSNVSEETGSGVETDEDEQVTPEVYAPSISPSTTLERSDNGHYYADAQVNGASVHFLVDTGATGVALTQDDARKAGIAFSPYEFEVIGSGASGPVKGKLVMIDRVTLGGKTVENVEGAILEGADMSLLGQSFLNRLGSVEMRGNTMVLR